MWKRILSLLLCISLLTSSITPAFAEDVALPQVTTPAAEKDPGAAISPLKKGDRAPFTGVELSPLAVATIVAQFSTAKDLVKIETDRTRSEEKARCEFSVSELKASTDADKKILQANVDARQKQIAALNEQLKKEQDSRPNVVLWTSLGGAAGIGLTLLTVFAVSRATK